MYYSIRGHGYQVWKNPLKEDLTHFADVHNLIASARQAQHLKCTFLLEKMRPNQNTSMNIDSAFRFMNCQESFDIFTVESILHPTSSNRNSVAKKLNEISDCNSVFRRAIGIHLAPILHKRDQDLTSKFHWFL